MLPGSHSNTPTWVRLWLVMLFVAFAGATLVAPTGWLGSDDAGYYAAAEYIASGTTITRVHHHYARLAMSLPIALSIEVFGDYVWAVILPTYLAAIGVLAVVIAIGKSLWGWREGLLAATLLLTVPYFTTLSTAAYPDVVACFWAGGGFLLALFASRANRSTHRAGWALGSGLMIAVALSAKVPVAPVWVGIAYAVWMERTKAIRTRCSCFGFVGLGLIVGLLIESGVFAVIARDPLFHWHALLTTRSSTTGAGGAAGVPVLSLPLVIDRLAMPFRRGVSGWGLMGVAFWPVMIVAGVFVRRSRALVAWACASYVALAFVPVSFNGGWHPFPNFHGRHLLPCVIPLVLCAAFLLCSVAERWLRGTIPEVLRRRCAGTMAILMTGLFFMVSRGDISGFADRPTQRIGRSIERMVATNRFDGARPVFMTPSMYWRFRLLFPPALRERIRVSAEPDAPTWWRDTCVDIVQRNQALPQPSRAYLLATPRQIEGKPEFWDYGVRLPLTALISWRDTPPLATAFRRHNGTVTLAVARSSDPPPAGAGTMPLLILAGGSRTKSGLVPRL